jgi:hypothetical protein
MPEVGYLVTSDKFFIAAYLLLLLTFVESTVTFVTDEKGDPELARKIDRYSAIVFPLACLAMFAWLGLNAVNT